MRTFDEISEDIRRVKDRSELPLLQALVSEMQSLGTPSAEALAIDALGYAAWISEDYPRSLEHYHRALAMYEQQGDLAGVARVLTNLGALCYSIGDYPESLGHCMRALALHEELDDRTGMAVGTANVGQVHESMGDYTATLEYYGRSLTLYAALGNREGAAKVTCSIGNVYNRTGDYPTALEHFRRAFAMHEELGDMRGLARVASSLGASYFETGDYPSALEQYNGALTMFEELGSRAHAATVTCSVGNVFAATGDYSAALEYYHRALALHQELGDRAGQARVTGDMAIVHYRTGDYSTALDNCSVALAMNKELGDRAGVASVIGNMITLLMKLERHDEAAELLERQSAMQMDGPRVRASHHANRALLAEYHADLEAAHHHLLQALLITEEAGNRAASAEYHELLRDLAQKRNDFAGYIEHNGQFLRLTEEIRGKEATQRMAMMEAERRMEGERREREKERALLYGALPKSVADRMIRGEDVSGDHFDHAAVMFLDIVGFTTHTSSMPPSDVVKLLENIFRTIDVICESHAVVKVKTIGDSYMCFRGDADASTNALSVASVALDVMKHAFEWPDGAPLQFRIGMHIGPAMAGVIGTQRLQYDVWGDTVNVASRMESAGEPGRVHVTEAFASELKRNTEYTIQNSIIESGNQESHEVPLVTRHLSLVTTPRGLIDLKGKGLMNTYWLESTE
ncbi:MAG: tetratricopeptide repeat protein [Bacteroidetes bacterium]|nr:tetratricopeptide repeat protein [Bacteroidota bacterium]